MHTQDRLVNLFETTIRVLGGLQSAFAMTPGGDRLLLLKVRGLRPKHCGLQHARMPDLCVPLNQAQVASHVSH